LPELIQNLQKLGNYTFSSASLCNSRHATVNLSATNHSSSARPPLSLHEQHQLAWQVVLYSTIITKMMQ